MWDCGSGIPKGVLVDHGVDSRGSNGVDSLLCEGPGGYARSSIMCVDEVLFGSGSFMSQSLMIFCARLGSRKGSLSRGKRVILQRKPVVPCARVRGPSISITWPVTTVGVVHWVGCEG